MDHVTGFDRFLHGGKVVAGFAMGGSVLAGLTFAWLPVSASVDVHTIGGAIGAVAGLILSARHVF